MSERLVSNVEDAAWKKWSLASAEMFWESVGEANIESLDTVSRLLELSALIMDTADKKSLSVAQTGRMNDSSMQHKKNHTYQPRAVTEALDKYTESNKPALKTQLRQLSYLLDSQGCVVDIWSLIATIERIKEYCDQREWSAYVNCQRAIYANASYLNPSEQMVARLQRYTRLCIASGDYGSQPPFFLYSRYAAYLKNYGMACSHLIKLLRVQAEHYASFISNHIAKNGFILIGLESRQFAFQVMELVCIWKALRDNSRIKNANIMLYAGEDFTANRLLSRQVAAISGVKVVEGKGELESLMRENRPKVLSTDQYALPAICKLADARSKHLLSHTLIYEFPQLLDEILDGQKDHHQTQIYGKMFRNTSSEHSNLNTRRLIIFCFKDVFRQSHASSTFMHHRAMQLISRDYLDIIMDQIYILGEDSLFINANTYPLPTIDGNKEIISYRELGSTNDEARISLMKLARTGEDTIAIGDCNGAFDVLSTLTRKAIFVGPEGVRIQLNNPFSIDTTLVDQRRENRLYKLYTHENITGKDGDYRVSGAHGAMMSKSLRAKELELFRRNTVEVFEDCLC